MSFMVRAASERGDRTSDETALRHARAVFSRWRDELSPETAVEHLEDSSRRLRSAVAEAQRGDLDVMHGPNQGGGGTHSMLPNA